ncbi:helix-turn-helix domain-containing protein [Paraburkholderia phosphatilytica]|uniref:helix-turn-helix domain-containing protein n=1 Tax=Paraburkholderia phosphatilytica TaxID=2282883 RepID=UPI000E49843F|nr:helix-turn-helix transcriptional regulator [Paraburkholderia phosphatilytica]
MARTLSKPDAAVTPWAHNLEALGEIVRNQRLEHGMRIDDAAALLGVSSNVLSRLENGRPVGSDRLFRVLIGLGLDMLLVERGDTAAAMRAVDKHVNRDASPHADGES